MTFLILAIVVAAAPAGPAQAGWIILRTDRGVTAVRADGGRIVPGRIPRGASVSPASAYRANLIEHPTGPARLLVRRKTGGLVADTWAGPGLLSWAPDERHLVVRTAADDGLALLELESGAWRRLTTDTNGLWDAEVAWSPDGARLAVVSRAPGRRSVSIIDLDGGRLDLGGLGTAHDAFWAGDGRLVVAAEGESDVARLVIVAPGGTTSVLAAETGVRYRLGLPLAAGVLLVRSTPLGEEVVAVGADALRPLTRPFARVEIGVPSPDGAAAAFLVDGRRGPEVWIVGADRSASQIWAGTGTAEILGWTLDEPPEPRGLTDYNYVRGP